MQLEGTRGRKDSKGSKTTEEGRAKCWDPWGGVERGSFIRVANLMEADDTLPVENTRGSLSEVCKQLSVNHAADDVVGRELLQLHFMPNSVTVFPTDLTCMHLMASESCMMSVVRAGLLSCTVPTLLRACLQSKAMATLPGQTKHNGLQVHNGLHNGLHADVCRRPHS